ncbi:MAG TPA: hypothetical protein VFU90_08320, partial [Candidatus Tumulicola sp.]|nr:hypothetical protein [Candidatus Tumulicola sp.]
MKPAAFSVAATRAPARVETVRVWDPLVRVFHWSLVAAFFGAYALGDDGGALHRALGYTALGLVGFRLAWGIVGGRYA